MKRIRITIALFAIIIFITGCTDKKEKIPDLTIPEGTTLPPENSGIDYNTD